MWQSTRRQHPHQGRWGEAQRGAARSVRRQLCGNCTTSLHFHFIGNERRALKQFLLAATKIGSTSQEINHYMVKHKMSAFMDLHSSLTLRCQYRQKTITMKKSIR